MGKSNIIFHDRENGVDVQETVMGDKALVFAYETLLGRTLWPLLFGSKFISALLGAYYDSPLSRSAVKSLAELPGCRPQDAEKAVENYSSFNEFFTRKLKKEARPFDPDPAILVSPGDGRFSLCQNIGIDAPIPVKGAKRTLRELTRSGIKDGNFTVAVLRLAPVDYHRYHYPCDCTQSAPPRVIRGKYHSVNPTALRKHPDLYVENTRHINELYSPVFGSFFFIEVGAFGVGSIVNTATAGEHLKMEEKGFFKFGGSTIIMVFENNAVKFDEDLTAASQRGVEVLLKCGMQIGIAANFT